MLLNAVNQSVVAHKDSSERQPSESSPMGAPKAEPGRDTSVMMASVWPRYFFGTISLAAANESCCSPPDRPWRRVNFNSGSWMLKHAYDESAPKDQDGNIGGPTRVRVWVLWYPLKARMTYLQLIAHPITPKALPVRKKLRRPKMSLHLPAIVMTTALDRDHAVAIQAILLEGPMS